MVNSKLLDQVCYATTTMIYTRVLNKGGKAVH